MKLWDKGYTVNNIVDRYTVGNDRQLDLKLAVHDVKGSIAHAEMLAHIGLLTKEEKEALVNALNTLLVQIEKGEFVIEEEYEDVHSKVEGYLVSQLGDVGKKIHTARSRNDQVLVDLHMYVKEELSAIKILVKQLFNAWMALAKKHEKNLMPGYTHTQVAMPSSFGLWFSAYAESMIDDVVLLNAALTIADQNPLGSAAGYGSSFPIDRNYTTTALGFKTLKFNSIAAQQSRGKLEKVVAFAIAGLAGTISKFSSDVCLYMSQNFAFIGFPDELTTGSSIMPHKKNPDVFELMRAKSNQLQSLPTEITMITNNLTSGYHRDFQQLKESIMTAIDVTKDNLEVCAFMMDHIKVNAAVMDNKIYDYLYTVEDVNELVMKGMPFRDAYKAIAEKVNAGEYQPKKEVDHQHIGSIGNLCLEDIEKKMAEYL